MWVTTDSVSCMIKNSTDPDAHQTLTVRTLRLIIQTKVNPLISSFLSTLFIFLETSLAEKTRNVCTARHNF